MADTPKTVTVRLDFSGGGAEFERILRRMVRVRPPVPPRRSLWQRCVERLHPRRR